MSHNNRVKPIELSEEQEKFFIDTWNDNRSYEALVILHDVLGFSTDTSYSIAKRLREKGKIRDKTHNRYSEKKALALKYDFENGRSLNEIMKVHNVSIKGISKYLKPFYGGEIPKRMPAMKDEIWKDIEGCSSHLVSNMGRIYVKSINRAIYGSLKHGYRNVSIIDYAGKRHQFSVHRLVAQAFVPNPDDKPQVDHIDSDPLNNKATNLRWVDNEEQMQNIETKKKMQLAAERQQKSWKLKPLIKKMLEIEPDKLELIRLIICHQNS